MNATFSEPIDASTLTSTTFVLRDAATSGIVPSGVAYNAGTKVATLTPTQALAASTTYAATISGGASGVKDVAGNALPGDRVVVHHRELHVSVHDLERIDGARPRERDRSERAGARRQVHIDIDGAIAGISFYKGATNSGTHVGNLWSSNGTLLATATFAGETASGWQQVSFATPVNITANTVYVASYHTNAGNPSYDSAFFTAAGVDRGPLHALATAAAAGNGVFVYGASAFPTQTYNGNNYWVDVVFTNGAPDTTPPAITSVTPPAGATNVATVATVTAAFSEPINAASVTSSTVALRDPSNSVVPATVTYNAGSTTAILTPLQPLAVSTTYAVTIAGGTTGVRDAAGNGLAADYTWSFTTAAGTSSCPCSIWSPSATPANASANDPYAQEVGVKFKSDVAGAVTAIRFYKGASNTGTHVGSLWTSTGTLLATATFAGETGVWLAAGDAGDAGRASAQARPTSRRITATPATPSYNSAYFTPVGVDNAPLHALSAPAGGGNGVYAYGASAFPTQTYNGNNYWVDVVFTTGGPDTMPPTVTSVMPASGAGGVVTSTLVTATFGEPVSAATLTTSTFVLRDAANNVVSSAVGYDTVANVATLTPASPLAAATTYTATVAGGGAGVKDLAGNASTADRVWSFTTGAGTACPCTILESIGGAGKRERQRSERAGTRHQVHGRCGRLHQRRPLLQGAGQYRHARRACVDERGHAFGHRDLHRRNRVGMAAGRFRGAGDRHGEHHLRRVLPHRQRQSLLHCRVLRSGRRRQRAAACADQRRERRQRVVHLRRERVPDADVQCEQLLVDVVFTAGGPDTTPPLVTTVTPGPGSTAVGALPVISATFGEAMSAASITTSTFVLRASNQLAVAATVSYNASTRTASLTPSQALAPSTTYTATIGGVTDAAGNPLAADYIWSFTTGDGSVSIWSAASIPSSTVSDSTAVELGVRFSSDVAGSVTGVRFYKSAGNTGSHVANLWTTTGTLLATTTFTNETASGWQQATFATPVPIAANTTYIVSYHTSSGHFSYDRPYFSGAGVDTPPLHALADGVSGGNGLFVYGAASAFPTQSYSSSNYWVDVVFLPQ